MLRSNGELHLIVDEGQGPVVNTSLLQQLIGPEDPELADNGSSGLEEVVQSSVAFTL